MTLAATRLCRHLRSVRGGRTALWYFMAGTLSLGASSGPLRSRFLFLSLLRDGNPVAAGLGFHVSSGQPVAALGAGKLGVDGVAARLVPHLDRRAVLAGHPFVAPSQERDQHRPQVKALLGGPVFEAVGTL